LSTKATGVGFLVVGVVLLLISATADSLGIGGASGIGWKQVAGIVVGVAFVALGVVRLRSRPV
jgi:hypothetical protein